MSSAERLRVDSVWAICRSRSSEFQNFIDNYVRAEELGLRRPLNNHLRRPDEWLGVNEVVRDDNRVLGLSFMFLAVCLLNMIDLLPEVLGAAPIVGLRRALGASRNEIFTALVEVGVIYRRYRRHRSWRARPLCRKCNNYDASRASTSNGFDRPASRWSQDYLPACIRRGVCAGRSQLGI
jgi:hypothetical protein